MPAEQGNGTSSIFEDDERVTTFDMHGANNYPFAFRSRMRRWGCWVLRKKRGKKARVLRKKRGKKAHQKQALLWSREDIVKSRKGPSGIEVFFLRRPSLGITALRSG